MVAQITPSTQLAYLIGVIAGDGCITRAGRALKLEIACDAAYPELISIYQRLVAEVTGLEVSVYKAKGRQCFRVVAFSLDLPVMLGLPAGAKSQSGFVIPEWIFGNVEYELIEAFVS